MTTRPHSDYPPHRLIGAELPIPASQAAIVLSAYLEKSRKAPYLHPDASLFPEGVQHGPKSGPSGGIAIHHLRRIEQGLRGETLELESKEELRAQFGEEAVPSENGGGYVPTDGETEQDVDSAMRQGDDERLDAVIAASSTQHEDEKTRRKREKKERKEREMAQKKRKADQVDGGAEETDQAKESKAAGAGDELEKKKQRKSLKSKQVENVVKGEASEAPLDAIAEYTEIPAKKAGESAVKKSKKAKKEGWQSKEEFEQSQTILEGEVGERDGAPKVKQSGSPPVVVKHDEDGSIIEPKKPKTDAEKAERKAAKKARNKVKRAAEAAG